MADAPKVAKHEPPKELESKAAVQKFQGRPKRQPVEQAEYFYDVKTTHIVSFFSSVAMLVSFLLMFRKDHVRDWKDYQEQHANMDFERLWYELGQHRARLEPLNQRIGGLERQAEDFLALFRNAEGGALELPITLFDEEAVRRSPRFAKPEWQKVHVEAKGAKPVVRELETIRGDHYDKAQQYNFAKDQQAALRNKFETAKHHVEEAEKNGDDRLPKFQEEFNRVKRKYDEVNAQVLQRKAEFDEVDTQNSYYKDLELMLDGRGVPGLWDVKERLVESDLQALLALADLVKALPADKPKELSDDAWKKETEFRAAARALVGRLGGAYAVIPGRKAALEELLRQVKLADAEKAVLEAFAAGKVPPGRAALNVLWRLSLDTERLSKEQRELMAEIGRPSLLEEDREVLKDLKGRAGAQKRFIEDLLRMPLGDLNKEVVRLRKEVRDRETRFEKERPSFANTVRNKPMGDFFAPTLKIQQVILSDVKDQLNFTKVDKVDRCHTCHAGIANKTYEVTVRPEAKNDLEKYVFKDPFLRKFVAHATAGKSEAKGCEVCDVEGRKNDAFKKQMPEPLTKHGAWSEDDAIRFVKTSMAHPRLDLYVSDSSKHPIARFGCTMCHEGDGRDTDFTRTVHTPDDKIEADAWRRRHGTPYGEERYNWNYRELWDLPMIQSKHLQSSCRRCHSQEVELDGGERYSLAMKLYERAGCYGCHRTDSYQILKKDLEDPRTDANRKVRRPGPPLTRIAAKVSEDWAVKWVLAPREFRPTTRMPHFFGQSNTRHEANKHPYPPRRDEAGGTRSPIDETIVQSIVKYVWSRPGQEETDPAPPAALKGEARRGELVVKQAGCLACHRVQDVAAAEYEKWVGKSRYLDEFAPSLAAVGSKIKSRTWLYHWVRSPKSHFKDSSMPSLRLSEQEAVDVVEYLMTLKNPGWEAVKAPSAVDEKCLEDLIYEQLRLKMPEVDAKAQLGGANPELMDRDNRLLWLGKKMVANYGCYSCHEMKKDGDLDWQNMEGIGVELTGSQPFGSKHHDRLDFGFAADDEVNHHGVTFTHGFTGAPLDAHVHEGRTPWLKAKLLNPRVFDGGKMASKPADELLRMPHFGFTEWEADLISTYVLSFTDHAVAGLVPGAQKRMSPDEVAMNRGNRIVRDSNCHSCHRFALDRLDVEWRRHDAARKKEVVSIERVEGRLRKEFKPDEGESNLKKWGLLPDKPTKDDLERVRLFSFAWAADHRKLALSPAINPENVFVAHDGTDWWYLDTNAKGEPVRRLVVRRQPMDGGDVLPIIEATKRALSREYNTARTKLTDERDEVEEKHDAQQNAALKKALKDQLDALNARVQKEFPAEKLMDASNEGEFEIRYPPLLRTQGVKTQAEWLYGFLKQPAPIRPNLALIQKDGRPMPDLLGVNVRMPTFEFTDEEAASLTRWFAARDHDVTQGDVYPHTSFPMREPAQLAARKEPLDKVSKVLADPATGCASCHYVNGKVPPGEPFKHGPELANVQHRLRPRWLYQWQRLPAEIYPGTPMVVYDFRPLFPGAPDPQREGVETAVDALLNWSKLNPNK